MRIWLLVRARPAAAFLRRRRADLSSDLARLTAEWKEYGKLQGFEAALARARRRAAVAVASQRSPIRRHESCTTVAVLGTRVIELRAALRPGQGSAALSERRMAGGEHRRRGAGRALRSAQGDAGPAGRGDAFTARGDRNRGGAGRGAAAVAAAHAAAPRPGTGCTARQRRAGPGIRSTRAARERYRGTQPSRGGGRGPPAPPGYRRGRDGGHSVAFRAWLSSSRRPQHVGSGRAASRGGRGPRAGFARHSFVDRGRPHRERRRQPLDLRRRAHAAASAFRRIAARDADCAFDRRAGSCLKGSRTTGIRRREREWRRRSGTATIVRSAADR